MDARILSRPDDVFFLTFEELPGLLIGARARLEGRRRARGRPAGDDLVGFGVSPGLVTRTVKILRAMTGLERLSGAIVVSVAIEPTLTPLFPLAGGMIAEMGGLLSHAAILAREYGLPAVVSVPDATRRLHDGDRVELDGTTGRIRVLERAGSAPPA